MALVSQEPTLFAISIAENIALGKKGASQEEVGGGRTAPRGTARRCPCRTCRLPDPLCPHKLPARLSCCCASGCAGALGWCATGWLRT
jgi:hypothetical protein